jgi:hypothetical protein
MKRPAPRAYAKNLRLWAVICVIFPLVAFAGPAAAATLDNLSVAIGATTYRIPHLTIEGGDPATLAGIFQSDAAGIETRLAGLSARRIVIPELLTETRVGETVERALYRDLVLDDVVGGRVGVAHAASAEQSVEAVSGRESHLIWRGLAFRGVDLRQLAHIAAVSAPETTAPLKPLLEVETIDSIAYESQSGDVSLHAGRLTLAGVTARARGAAPVSPADRMKHLTQAADDVSFARFEIQDIAVDGRVPSEPASFALRIGRIDLRGLATGTLAETMLDHFALKMPDGGNVTLTQLNLRDVALATLFDGGAPHIGHAGLKELVVDLPTPQSGAESRLRFKLADANLDLANFRERTPTKFNLDIDRLFVDLAARGATGLAAPLLALGYRDIDLSASAAGAWDEKTGAFTLAPVRVTAREMGEASLAATFGDVSALAFSSSPLVARAAAATASIKSLELTLNGGGLIERLMAQPAAPPPSDKTRADIAQILRGAMQQNLGAGPNARRIGDALADYLRAPQHLHLRFAGKTSINALDMLARKPADILEGLEVEASSRANEPAPSQQPSPQPAP